MNLSIRTLQVVPNAMINRSSGLVPRGTGHKPLIFSAFSHRNCRRHILEATVRCIEPTGKPGICP